MVTVTQLVVVGEGWSQFLMLSGGGAIIFMMLSRGGGEEVLI